MDDLLSKDRVWNLIKKYIYFVVFLLILLISLIIMLLALCTIILFKLNVKPNLT